MKQTRYKLNKLKRHIVVFDNIKNEERFTIIFRKTSDMYKCTLEPVLDKDTEEKCCNICKGIYDIKCNKTNDIKSDVNKFISDNITILGKRVMDLKTLPEDVQRFIILTTEYNGYFDEVN